MALRTVPSRDALASRSLRMKSGAAGVQQPYLYYLETFGCAHNQSDGEVIRGLLDEAGYVASDMAHDADVVIFNSCAVKGPTQSHLLHVVKEHAKSKPVVVAGCVAQSMSNLPALQHENIYLVGVQQFSAIVAMVDGILLKDTLDIASRILPTAKTTKLLAKAQLPSLHLPKRRTNPYIEIIPINLGCLHACTYCKTKHARGHLRSYPVNDIVQRAKDAIAQGVTQLWLTSEDTGAYGKDIGTTLPQLVHALLANIPSNIMIRIGMMNPPYVLEYVDDLCELLNHPQVFSFLHIPVQAGSNAVLTHMKRGYTIEQFQQAVDAFRARVPNITIATDIICGYPTEGEEDFEQTIELVRRNNFPIIYISQFYSRPGTIAATLTPLASQEIKRRSTAITRVFKEQRSYDVLVGTECMVWCSSISDDRTYVVAHTKSYVVTLLPLDASLLGTPVHVRIVRVGKHFVEARVV